MAEQEQPREWARDQQEEEGQGQEIKKSHRRIVLQFELDERHLRGVVKGKRVAQKVIVKALTNSLRGLLEENLATLIAAKMTWDKEIEKEVDALHTSDLEAERVVLLDRIAEIEGLIKPPAGSVAAVQKVLDDVAVAAIRTRAPGE